MEILKRETLIAEIAQFKEEALKMHIVEVLANTYEHSNLFDCNIDVDGSVIWYKAQARQLWDFWQAAKAQAVPEGFVLVPKEPTLEMCHRGRNTRSFKVQDIYKAMIEAQEQTPFKIGDLVEPIDHRYTLASGCQRYHYAFVVNTNPFQLMSEEGDMYWSCTVEASGYKLIKSNDQLPEAVSIRMIREGLLAPVKAHEQANAQ